MADSADKAQTAKSTMQPVEAEAPRIGQTISRVVPTTALEAVVQGKAISLRREGCIELVKIPLLSGDTYVNLTISSDRHYPTLSSLAGIMLTNDEAAHLAVSLFGIISDCAAIEQGRREVNRLAEVAARVAESEARP